MLITQTSTIFSYKTSFPERGSSRETMLGKRKRDTIVIPRKSAEESQNKIVPGNGDSQDLFRQHFEARFKPLEEALTRVEKPLLTCLDEDSGSEWDGIFDRDTRQTAEVIEHL